MTKEKFFHIDADIKRIEYESTSHKTATLLVDGVDISRFVTSIKFNHVAGHLAVVHIELKVRPEEIKINGLAEVSYKEIEEVSGQWQSRELWRGYW